MFSPKCVISPSPCVLRAAARRMQPPSWTSEILGVASARETPGVKWHTLVRLFTQLRRTGGLVPHREDLPCIGSSNSDFRVFHASTGLGFIL